MMADLFFTKKLIQQAEYWYQQAASKQEGIQPEPLLGLLRISLLNKDNKNSESLILAIEEKPSRHHRRNGPWARSNPVTEKTKIR